MPFNETLRIARERKSADIVRLKMLGGRPRSDAEEAEYRDTMLRNPEFCRAYFENRLWEKPKAPATSRS